MESSLLIVTTSILPSVRVACPLAALWLNKLQVLAVPEKHCVSTTVEPLTKDPLPLNKEHMFTLP